MNTEINPSSTTGARHVMKQKNLIPSSLRHCKRNTLAAACMMAMSGMAGAQTVALSITYGSTASTGSNTTAASSLSGFSRQPGAFQYTTSDALNTPATLYIGSSLTGTSATPTSITNQIIQALTSGNVLSPDPSVGKTFDLALLNNGSTTSAVGYALQYSSGLVTTGVSPSYNSQTLTSSTTGALIELSQSGMTSSVRALNTNTIKSNLELNNSQLLASGVVSGTYSSTTDGLASGNFAATGAGIGDATTPTTGATGSVVLSAVQGAFNANATSTVSNGDVAMTLRNTSSTAVGSPKVGTLTDALSATNNTVAANVQANVSNSVYQATSTSGAWTGSVAVATVQSTVDAVGGNAYTATNEKSTITADVRDTSNAAAGSLTTLGGALTLGNNTISSSSSLNTSGSRSATTGLITTAGNAIQFDSSSSVTGGGTTTTSSVGSGTASAAADLALLNLQAAKGTDVLTSVDPSSAGSFATVGGVTLSTDQLVAGGSTSQNSNRISATSVNNQGGNLISVGQSSSSSAMSASSAVVNDQSGVNTSVLATVKNAEVATRIGYTSKTNTGTATVDSNSISAMADGNVSGSTTALSASTLSVSANISGTQGVTLNANGGTASAGVGVTSLNTQSNNGLVLTATNESTQILLLSAIPSSPATAEAVSSFQGVLTNNTLNAVAAGNTAVSTVSTTATTASGLSAAVGNSQSNTLTAGNISAVAGSASKTLNIKLLTGDATNSQLTLSNDSILATARSNRASDSLTVNVSASGSGPTTLFTSTDPTFTAGDPNQSSKPTSALADLTVANAQVHTGESVTAASMGTIDLVTGALSGAAATPMTVTSNNNTIKSASIINEAANSATLNVGQMSALSGGVASAQTINSLSASAAAQSTAITISNGGNSVSGSQINMQGNTLAATTNGNLASNTLNSTSSLSTTRGLVSNATTSSTSPAMTVVADLGIASNQIAQTATLTSLMDTTGTAANEGIRLTVGAVSDASQITQSSNSIQATSEVNTVNNLMTLSGGNMNQTTSGLASRQVIDNTGGVGTVSSTVRDTVALTTAAVSGGSVLTMDANTIGSTSLGNYATNGATASGTTLSNASGATGVVSAYNQTTAIQRVTSDHALLNVQSDTDTAYTATTTATQTLTTAALSGNSTLAFTGNQATSAVQINYASNSQTWQLGTSFDRAQVGVASSQQVTGAGSSTATALTTSTQSVTTASSALASTNVELSGNIASSSAVDNIATNSITVAGTSSSSKPVITGAGLTSSNKAILTGSSKEVAVTADVGLANYQNSTGKTPSATTTADVTLVVGAVSKASSTPTLTLSDNTVSASAESNAASNRISLTASNMTAMTSALANGQNAAADLTATVQPNTATGVLSLTAGTVSGATLTLSGNTVAASATVNRASNVLEVTATNLGGQGGAASLYGDTAGVAGSNQVGTVDFSVVNAQYAAYGSPGGNVSATTLPLLMRANASTLTSSSLTMNDNTVQALASGNVALNTLSLNASATMAATGAVKNVQSVDTDLNATLGNTSAHGTVFGANIPTLSGATLNFSNNSFQAQAGGNNATNVLNALAASSIAPSSGAASPTYAVLNRQETSVDSTFTAKVQNLDIGIPAGATTSWSNSNVTLQGNRVVALAYGNMASNVVAMNALAQGQDTATASITNTQNSRGTLQASVTNVNIAASGTGVTTGSVNMGGNSITSQIVANQVYNSITSR